MPDPPPTLGVLGLGYVGLPLAVTAAAAGLDVTGYDVDERVVSGLRDGHSHVGDVSDTRLTAALDAGTRFTSEPDDLAAASALLIAVPSPLGRDRRPDTAYIEDAADVVRRVCRPGTVVVLESTTYPGTTEDLLVPAVADAGLTLDDDVWVAFSPERVDPGGAFDLQSIPKVVGGVTPASGERAAAVYRRFVDQVHLVRSAREAELTKLLENTYRAVNIAMINEFAQIAHALEIDIWEVVDAAATKPFGFQPFRPGPGVGGHCIPLDPQYLAWSARQVEVATRFIDLADDVNLHMPDWIVTRVLDLLNDRGLPARGTRVLALGMAYKRDVGDDRESPSLDVVERLALRGAHIGLLDAHVPPERLARHGHEVVAPDAELSDWDLGIVLTDHDGVDYAALAEQVPVVFDTRGVYRRLGLDAANVVAL